MSSGSSLTTQDYVNQIPVRLRKALYKFQKEGVLYALKLKGRILIGDEMGLGKTIQAISVACAFRNWPCLVIAPAVVKLNWVDELEKWTGCEPSVIKVIEGRQDVDGWKDAKFVICTYGLFTRDAPVVEHIESHGFETVIVDESHSLKNDKAVRTRAIVPIIEKATHAILLSGTPALARPVELYPQVSSLSKSYFGTYSEYTRKFCNARRGRFGWDVSGAANLAELHGLLKHVMIRRKKDNVLTQLPKKLKSRVLIDLDAKSKKSMAKIMGQLKDVKSIMKATLEAEQRGSAKAKSDAFNAHKEQRRLLMRAFHDTGVAKLPGVKGYINNFLDSSPDNKCLIFGHHRDVLDGIESNVSTYRHVNKKGKKKRIAYIRIDGSTPHRERADNVRKFQSDPNCRVGILGILAGGVGITLTAASHVFFAELHWTPGILQQAEDRAHRIGQTAKNVHINYMVAKGSLDDIMWSIVCSKVNVVSCALEGTKQKLKVDVLKKKRGGGRSFQSFAKQLLKQTFQQGSKVPLSGNQLAEGGGECDLTNFRTLCTPCHKKETSSLNQRLARKRLAESAKGTFDIRTFLTPSGEDSHVAATPATESRPRKKKPRTEPPSSAFLKPSPRVLKKDRKKHDFVDESSSDDEEDDLPIDQLTAKYLKERKLLNFMSPHKNHNARPEKMAMQMR
eukprot:g1628.t1